MICFAGMAEGLHGILAAAPEQDDAKETWGDSAKKSVAHATQSAGG